MVALELCALFAQEGNFKVKGALLISSGRTDSILKESFKWKARLASKFPKRLLKWILKNQMLLQFLRTESLSAEQSRHLREMIDSIDMEFFQWSLLACSQWNPRNRFTFPQAEFPIFEIQGEHDPIIPLSKEAGVTTLSKAKHLIQYTHSQEINQWIRKVIS